MGNSILSTKSIFTDLGIIFDSKFSFADHIVSICKNAFSILGFIKIMANLFKNPDTLKILYCSLVRSRLEFASVIWYPQHMYLIDMIESVQKKALRFLYFKSFGHYTNLVPYTELLNMFNLHTLTVRRQAAALVYLHQLVSGALDDGSVLARLNIAVPRPNSRPRALFSSRFANSNLGDYAPTNILVKLHNSLLTEIDIFTLNRKQFPRAVLHHLSRD